MTYTLKEKETNNKTITLVYDNLTEAYRVQVLENVKGLWYGRTSRVYPTKQKADKAYYRYCKKLCV